MIAAAERWTRKVDRAANRRLKQAWPVLLRWTRRVVRWTRWAGNRLRPVAVFVLRAFAAGERWLRQAGGRAARWATRAGAVVTRRRAILGVVVASAICLVVSQFVDYRAVEIGQPGYAGLPTSAQPPAVGVKTAGEAHSYLLIPLALIAAILAAAAIRRPRPRGLGLTLAGLGLVSLAVILIVDLPAGLDAGAQASRFSGATATLRDGFYAELAACVGLILGGLLYYARPCRTPINLSGRVVSALRRRPRRRASSRGRETRSGSPRRSGAASAPASRP